MNLIKATLAAITVFFCGVAHAQTPEITSYFPSDGEDYRGYSITNVTTRLGRGYAAIGNHTTGGANNRSIHFLVMPSGGQGAVGSLLTFDHDDVRAVAINSLTDNIVVLTLQVRDFSGLDRIMVVVVDCASPSSPSVISARMIGDSQSNFYPLGAAVDTRTKTCYIGGYSTYSQPSYPAEPGYSTPKSAVIVKFDLSTGTASYLIMNTPIDYTIPAPNSGWSGQYNDYDLIQRVKFIRGELYAVGSSNAPQGCNSSKIWVGHINSNTMNPILYNHFGGAVVSSSARPDIENGYHGTDIIEDVNNPGSFYVTGQNVFGHTWTISGVQPNLQITPGSASYANTLTYAYSADIKGHGAFTQNADRISIYGTMRLSGAISSSPYMASINDGAIPFVTSFNPVWGTSGLSAGHLKWWVEGNRPSAETYMPAIYSPYLMTSSMSRYSTPVFATQYDAANQKYQLAMMGHIGDGTSTPKISPRLIFSDEDGEVTTCPGSQEEPLTYSGVLGYALEDAPPYQFGQDIPPLSVVLERVQIQPWSHTEDNCSGGGVYRQQKPTAVHSPGQQSELLSLFPNPASDKLSVDLGSAAKVPGEVSVTFTDVTGRKVLFLEQRLNTGSAVQLALPHLNPGLYTCTVRYNDNAIGTRKLSIE